MRPLRTPSYTAEELKEILIYVYRKARIALRQNIDLHKEARYQYINDGTLYSFVARNSPDRDRNKVFGLTHHLPAALEDPWLHNDPRFKRTIAALGIINRKAQIDNEALKEEALQYKPIVDWVNNPKRADWKWDTESPSLSQFSPEIIKEGVVYALEQANHHLTQYSILSKRAQYYFPGQLDNVLEDPEQLVKPIDKPYVDFWGMDEEDIRDFDLSGIINESDEKEEKKAKESSWKYFRKSFCLLTKTVHDLKMEFDKADKALQQLEIQRNEALEVEALRRRQNRTPQAPQRQRTQ